MPKFPKYKIVNKYFGMDPKNPVIRGVLSQNSVRRTNTQSNHPKYKLIILDEKNVKDFMATITNTMVAMAILGGRKCSRFT